MREHTRFIIYQLLIFTAACGGSGIRTSSEQIRGSSYFPVSPKPVRICGAEFTSQEILDALPNETIRISTRTLDQTGSLTFGAGAIGEKGKSYEIVVDYAKYTTAYLKLSLESEQIADKGKYVAGRTRTLFKTRAGSALFTTDTRQSKAIESEEVSPLQASKSNIEQRIPIYVGVGLRIKADIHVLEGNVQLSLFGIGAAASAGRVAGTLIVQTLGIFGESISPLVPLPNDISQTSIQSAMQSLASIKAKMYDKNGVGARPQLIGFETILSAPEALQLVQATIEGTFANAEFTKSKELLPALIGDESCSLSKENLSQP